MLPSGHIAAGYLTAYALLHASANPFSGADTGILLAAGAILGAAPDIDFIPFFIKHRSLRFQANDTHRRYITHAPILWLMLGAIVYAAGNNPAQRALGLLLWLAPMSHFLGDSFEYGIRWAWPFSSRFYALFNRSAADYTDGGSLLTHYAGAIRRYILESRTFFIELALILAAIGVAMGEFLL